MIADWDSVDTAIVLTGIAAALACAVPGLLLVLRRQAMLADAISHAVLPGIVGGYLLAGRLDSPLVLAGAALAGLLAAWAAQALERLGRVEGGAALGLVFTGFFALGLVGMRVAADSVDLDPSCVLFGAIELAALDTVPWLGVDWPRQAVVLAAVAAVNWSVWLALGRDLRLAAFDPALAAALGRRPGLLRLLVMAMAALTAVAAFEAVGSVLVVALFAAPAATAWLLADRFGLVLVLTVLVGALASVLGHVAAIVLPGLAGLPAAASSGSMALVMGLMVGGAWLLAPGRGLCWQLARRAWHGLERLREDVLGYLWRLEECAPQLRPPSDRAGIARAVGAGGLVLRLAIGLGSWRREWRWLADGRLELNARGRFHARHLVRSHRLWELFLQRHMGLAAEALHAPAARLEHLRDAELMRHLGEAAGHHRSDPHGRPVPSAEDSGSARPAVGEDPPINP